MTSDQEAKVIAEPQVQQAQEAKEDVPLLVQYETFMISFIFNFAYSLPSEGHAFYFLDCLER